MEKTENQDSSVYTDIILELYKNPPNYGHLIGPNFKSSGGNPSCGDFVSFEAKIVDSKIVDIKFVGNGCAISKASAAMLTEMVKGKNVEEVLKLEGQDMFEKLGQIIQTRIKCALVGLVILKRGLEKFEQNSNGLVEVSGIKI